MTLSMQALSEPPFLIHRFAAFEQGGFELKTKPAGLQIDFHQRPVVSIADTIVHRYP